MVCAYRFVLEVQDAAGGVLHRRAVSPDWEPAVVAARLAGVRAHGAALAGCTHVVVEPVWRHSGAPGVAAVRVLMTHDGHEWAADCAADVYFVDIHRGEVAGLLESGALAKDDVVRLAVTAYPSGPIAEPATLGFQAVEQPHVWAVRRRAPADGCATAHCGGPTDDTDIAVVVPDVVLQEVVALTHEAGDRETGGVLIGHLCHDAASGDVGVEVTAQVPARHTAGDAVKLTFTSETWTDVRAAVALRRRDERLLGWWHSHPAQAWCRQCPDERQRSCRLAVGFLSADDKALHRAMFPAAFTQALVVTQSVSGIHAAWFGWRDGTLQPRGFVMARSPHDAAPQAWAAVGHAPAAAIDACATADAESAAAAPRKD